MQHFGCFIKKIEFKRACNKYFTNFFHIAIWLRPMKAKRHSYYSMINYDWIVSLVTFFHLMILKHSVQCNLFAKIQTSDNDTYFKAIELCCYNKVLFSAHIHSIQVFSTPYILHLECLYSFVVALYDDVSDIEWVCEGV